MSAVEELYPQLSKKREKMKIALLKNYPTDSRNIDELFVSVGMNSGNIVYWESLIRLFNPDIVSFKDIEKFVDYDAVIVTDLCWIRENVEYEYIERLIDSYHIPFVPMSIGLQNDGFNPDFKLSEQLVRMLKKMQERAVLGVRGEYTASILRKYGILNIAVIGCPSMYYWNNRNLKIEDDGNPVNVCCNFKSFGGTLNSKEVSLLKYFCDNKFLFVEQTQGKLDQKHIKENKWFHLLKNYVQENQLLEFDYKSWAEKLKDYNFSLGLRYHGNILPLHQNIKALFITIDSRTQEMIDLFHLPYIKKDEFDENKTIEYYFNLADYSEFNANYSKMFDIFAKFVADNQLIISQNATPIEFVAKKNVRKINLKKIKKDENVCLSTKDVTQEIIAVETQIDHKETQQFESQEWMNEKQKNIVKDRFLENVDDGENADWKHLHSKESFYDTHKKLLKCGKEKNCWNILTQKLVYTGIKGRELTLSVTNKTIGDSQLNLFVRYQLQDGQMKYLSYSKVQNNNESTDDLTFTIPNDIPDNVEIFFGVYLNEPDTEAIINEIQLFCS